MSDLVSYFRDQQDAMVELLKLLIEYESPSNSKAHVDALSHFIEGQFRELGASSVTRIDREQVGDYLLAKWNEDAHGKPILFLVHMDTVWPVGTLQERPIRVEDGRLYGPGAVDMKGGIVIVLAALRGLRELNEFPQRPIWVLATSDEEIGSVDSQSIIEETAQQCGLVLVMEPATPEGALKTWRKGVSTYKVYVKGRASHAGNAPEQGINAVVELAQQAVLLHEMNDLKHGTSVSVTMAEGGIASNVIPDKAWAHVDVRTMTAAAWKDIHEKIMGLEPCLPGATVQVELEHARGPMERNAGIQAAFGQAKRIAETLGMTLREDGSGGGSDGNFTAAMGIPTLDGLGAEGNGLHAVHEHVLITGLTRRAALVAAMLRDWVME